MSPIIERNGYWRIDSRNEDLSLHSLLNLKFEMKKIHCVLFSELNRIACTEELASGLSLVNVRDAGRGKTENAEVCAMCNPEDGSCIRFHGPLFKVTGHRFQNSKGF